MSNSTFCTVFDCMDGRCQEHTMKWCVDNLDVDYPDTLTLPGMDKQLASVEDNPQVDYLKNIMAKISVDGHGSNTAVIVGHTACAGNPVSDEVHKEDIKKAVKEVASWGIFNEVIGLFEGGCDDPHDWVVEVVCRIKK